MTVFPKEQKNQGISWSAIVFNSVPGRIHALAREFMHKWKTVWSGLLLMLSLSVQAASVVGSKHDLSTPETPEPCVYCHTPHGASDSITAPLWNRRITNTSLFQPYDSPTMGATPASTPNAYSLACLSCHDDGLIGGGTSQGAVYNNDQHGVINQPNRPEFNMNCNGCHRFEFNGITFDIVLPDWWQIGPDLRNDHPISFDYASAQALDPELKPAPDSQKGWGNSDLKLFNGRVECPTCHNPHDSTYVPFLRKPNNQSQICYTCHDK